MTATPRPGDPAEGKRHIIGSTPSGAFSGRSGKIADYQDGTWAFLTRRTGWIVWDATEAALFVFDGSGWTPALPTPVARLPLGINCTADKTNRLGVSADETLLNDTGDGHQLKINKATPADTGSLLFQTGCSAREEMGLTGNDDFAIKDSADGAIWTTALKGTGDTGMVPMAPLGTGIDSPTSELHLFFQPLDRR